MQTLTDEQKAYVRQIAAKEKQLTYGKYVFGITYDDGAERHYDGTLGDKPVQICIETRRYKNGEWGLGKTYIRDNDKDAWRKYGN